jgi:L-alanine-DL-glutamate epimerase-like enolase superfamily enzyme
MKITDIHIQHLRRPLDPPFNAAWDPIPRRSFTATLVFVETDEGITGIGSGDSMYGFEDYKHFFIGQDPMPILRHVQVLETLTFHASRYWPLEAALWDIIGQACGQPVAQLFGGFTTKLLAYASCGEFKAPALRAESALALRDEGFRALKIRIDRHRLDEGIATVAAVRKAVGATMDIMIDLNQAWRMPGDTTPTSDVAEARRLAAALHELGVLWLEEPLPGHDVKGLAALRPTAGVRIAGGEMVRSLPELLAYVDADALDVYQPDVVLAVGMLRTRMLAELVMTRNRWFTPHTWSNGYGLLANLQVTAGVGGGPYLEFPYDPPGWSVDRRDFFFAEPLRVDREGYIHVPARPGMGAVLDMDAVKKYALD